MIDAQVYSYDITRIWAAALSLGVFCDILLQPFLKFGIFPERLFELWGCDKKAPPSYYYNELKRRASLCNLEQYPFSLPSHPPSSQHRARQTTTAVSPEAASLTKNKEESLTTQKKDDPQSVTHNGTASSESFEKTLHQRIRQAADAFRESTKMSLYNDEEREQLLHSEYRRMTDIKLSCPVDPTWRNVYYSRVRLMWKPQKPSLSYLVNRLQTYDLEDARNAALKEARKKRVAWHLPFSDTEDEAHSYRKSFLGLNQETVTPKPHDGKTTSHNPKSEQDASDQNTHPQLPARRAMHDMAVGWDMGDRGDRVSWSAENIDSVITRRCPFAWIRLEKKQQALLFNYSGKRRTPLRFHLSRKSLRRSRNPLDHATLLSKLPEGAGVSSGSSSLGGVVDQGPLVNLNYMGLKSIPKNALLLAYKKLLDARVLNPAIWEKRRQRLESRANVLSLNQRPPLKIRRGRRAVNCSSKIAGEGKQWLMFHQTRSSIAEHNLNFLAPPPVPVPASVCFPSGELTRELTNHRHYLKGHNKYLPWPTFIPTLFRGPAQYEDLQEALLHAMWAAYKTSEHRIQFSATTSSADAMPLLSSARPSSKLRLWISGYMIPHDDKRFRCGDDAWFGSEGIMALGVCDGVGEMSDTHWRAAGFDCRQFGENVLQEAKSHIQSLRDKNEVTVGTRNRMILPEGRQRRENVWKTEEFEVNPASDTPSRMALDAMISAYYTRRSSWGAITCIIGCLNETGTRIGFANIGDSRAVILRRLPYSTGPLDIVGATNPEQHDWNLPVQLARLPDQRHVQMMRHDERFKTLVESLDACRATGQAAHDAPESATLYDFDLQEGDLILVATDGLWDNLFDGELAALCGVALSPLESQLITDTPFLSTAPRDIAKGLCLAAYWKSLQDHVETPFSQTVRRHGGMGFQRGGKTDDITVVAAWVVAESYANTPDLLESCRAQYAEWKKKIEGSLARSTLEPGKTPKRGPEDKQNGLPQ